MNVQQQENESDCGVFEIAFAKCSYIANSHFLEAVQNLFTHSVNVYDSLYKKTH